MAAVISNYSIKRVKSKLVCYAERGNNRLESTEDKLFIRYKVEVMLEDESIQSFCLNNKVPYNLFYKWYRDVRHQIVSVQF